MIAHLPIGYLAGKALFKAKPDHALFWAFLLGSVAPDFDMLWFLLVDQGAVHHHSYLTHRPILWFAVLVAGLLARKPVLIGLGAGAILHLVLDSIVGRVAWLWPFFDHNTTLIVVPATQSHWVLSFVFHWTFAVEIVASIVALIVLVLSRRRASVSL